MSLKNTENLFSFSCAEDFGLFSIVCLSRPNKQIYNISNGLMLFFTDTDLHNVIKKGNILKDIHKRYIMYQVSNFAACVHELFCQGLFSIHLTKEGEQVLVSCIQSFN